MERKTNLKEMFELYQTLERNTRISYDTFERKYIKEDTINVTDYTTDELAELLTESLVIMSAFKLCVSVANGVFDKLEDANNKVHSIIGECIDMNSGNYYDISDK